MKKLCYFFILIVFFIFFSMSGVEAQKSRYKRNTVNRNYNPATVETITGSVIEVKNISSWGIHLTLKAGTDKLRVDLGPEWFLKDKITLVTGDTVTVTGSKVKGDGEVIMIARIIKKGDISVELRDERGIPKWAGRGKRNQGI